MRAPALERELEWEERATWGECPVCKATHGEPCNGAIGIPVGLTIDGQLPKDGAHLGRIQHAPVRIRVVPL